jgi:hypothetical protein
MKKVSILKTLFLFFLGFGTLALYGQEVYTFTNCGATGRYGPTQTQVNSEYSGTNLEGKVTITTQGIQEWTVPKTGDYKIEVYGAEGAWGGYSSSDFDGGDGAYLSGTFSFTLGDVLKILVGQQGTTVTGYGGGGGGGTFVVTSGNSPLIVTGGGGGGGYQQSMPAWGYGKPGVITTGNGNGGGNTLNPGSDDQAGAGFNTNGWKGASTGDAAQSFLNGGVGGVGYLSQTEGGFGGGGGGGWSFPSGGSGGGYQGGEAPGSVWSDDGVGQGGLSYNSGTNQSGTSGARTGNGLVVITVLCDELSIDASADTVCSGSEVTLTATSGNGGTISWDNGITNGVAFTITETTTFTATSDNEDDCVGTITIIVGDFEPPVLTTKDITLYLNEAGEAILNADSVVTGASDNCSLVDTTLSQSVFGCEDLGANNVDVTLIDGVDSTTVQTITVTVMDTISPTITVKPDTVLYLDAAGTVSIAKEDLVTDVGDNCSVVDTTISETDFDCTFADSTIAIALTVIDGAGNQVTDTSYITVLDTIKPVLDEVILADSVGECSVDSSKAPTATDNCSGVIQGVPDTELPINSGDTTIVTWTFTDASGNSVTQTQRFIISDDVDPALDSVSLMDIIAVCEVDTILPPTATDACAGKIFGVADVSFPISAQDSTKVTWTFDDGNGNSVTQVQWVIISDTTPPVFTIPEDAVTCDGTAEGIGVNLVGDNCNGNVTVTYELTGATTGTGTGNASNETFMAGVTTVTYTVADVNGNSLDSSLTVTYYPVDTAVTVDNNTITATGTGTYQWIDCPDNSVISGATSQSYTPTVSGSYAVVVTNGECSDTSACQSITIITSIENMMLDRALTLYPNPVENTMTVNLGATYSNVTVEVVKIDGVTVVLTESYVNVKEFIIATSQLASGVYMLQVTTENQRAVVKLIKK